jgi:hypothetical protein
MQTHTIHHYEDQPELIRWIPGGLLNRFCTLHPEWIRDEGAFEESEKVTTFKLFVDGEEHVVEYRIYQSLETFKTDFEGMGRPGDIALADLMNKDAQPVGKEVYFFMTERLGSPDAVYVLTAFPDQVTFGVSASHIVPKPVNARALADLLIGKLAIGEAS